MDTIQWLEKTFGGRWTGVTFHRNDVPPGNRPGSPTRFCTVLADPKAGPTVLTRDRISCPGASRSFGWATKNDDAMASEIAGKTGMPRDAALRAIKDTPRLDAPVQAVALGTDATPDVVLSCMQPEAVMQFIARYEAVLGTTPIALLSSVMAACGNLAVRSYLTGELALSFGCPDSRAEARIGRDRLIVSAPLELANRLRKRN